MGGEGGREREGRSWHISTALTRGPRLPSPPSWTCLFYFNALDPRPPQPFFARRAAQMEQGWAEDDQVQSSWCSDPSKFSAVVSRLVSDGAGSDLLVGAVQQMDLGDPCLMELTGAGGPLKSLVERCFPAEVDEENMTRFHSATTCCLDVLEGLVLQLGGYGCVAPEPQGGGGGEEGGGAAAGPLATPDYLAECLSSLGAGRIRSMLRNPVADSWLAPDQRGITVPVLGVTRLKVARCVEAMVLLASPGVDAALASSQALPACLDCMFRFESASLLHQSVANLLVHAIEGGVRRRQLQRTLLEDCGVLKRLLDCFKGNEEVREREA